MSEAGPARAPKVDPETLAIRTKPARAIRFRRGVIIAIAAMGSVSLMAVTWIALKPRVFSAVADRQELSEPSNRPSTDALNGLPSTYGDVPRLGPPLPGDTYADQRIFSVTNGESRKGPEKLESPGHKNGHSPSRPRLYLVKSEV